MTTLRPMTSPEYANWLKESIPAYAAEKVASGQWTEDESISHSVQENEELLPQGLRTPDNFLFTIVDSESSSIGMLWFAVQTKFNKRVAYVFDVSITPTQQRRGHAKRAFAELESLVQTLGLSGIALHVFGHNAQARALYAKLGYEPTNISLFKPLTSTDA
jgi:ribosomal protein S18 acetylase RimI-like enzyme